MKFDGADEENAYRFGYELVAPVVSEYLLKLDIMIESYARGRDAKVLFMSRAGVRILRLYKAFLKTQGRQIHTNVDLFWVSRLMCVKGVWNRCFAEASAILEEEFRHAKLSDLVEALFRSTCLPHGLDMADPALALPGSTFSRFIWGPSQPAYHCRWHLAEQSEMFSKYVGELLGGHPEVLLVDSGWQGTAQTLLAAWRPEVKWWGGYFGRLGTAKSDRRYWDQMFGLVFEADAFDPRKAETSVILHRHLIEDLFEPSGRSIEHLSMSSGIVEAPGAVDILCDQPTKDQAPIFCAVLDYISSLRSDVGPGAICEQAQLSWPKLARVLAFPTAQEATSIGSCERSADFGRLVKVPLLLPAIDRYSTDNSENRIAHSLWPSAQAAIEYGKDLAISAQQSICGFKIKPSDLALGQKPTGSIRNLTSPSISIITRTMDRPTFLERAITSVSGQTSDNYEHVIVCDGGDIQQVIDTVRKSQADVRKTVLIDNVVNRGMEASSNIGIRDRESEYIVIHDDDDSWQPDFLSKMIEYLDSAAGLKYGGAISHTWYISEEVTRSGIIRRDRKPYHDWVQNVQLMEMAQENFFAPISFVFRRSAYNTVGGFDEAFPVLGDWDFNLRFLEHFDIGVLAEKLANYHHRDVGNVSLFPNSVTASITKHAEFNAIMRNKFIRSQISGAGLGVLVNLGMSLTDMRNTARRTLAMAESFKPHNVADVDARLERLQHTADKLWLALATVVEDHAEQVAELEAENRLLNEREVELRTNMVAATTLQLELAQYQRLADERWIALSMLAGSTDVSSELLRNATDGTPTMDVSEDTSETYGAKVEKP